MRRLFWLTVGVAAGSTGTLWAERKIRERLEQLTPEHAANVVVDKAKDAGNNVLVAISRGRETMADTERELRGKYSERPSIQRVR